MSFSCHFCSRSPYTHYCEESKATIYYYCSTPNVAAFFVPGWTGLFYIEIHSSIQTNDLIQVKLKQQMTNRLICHLPMTSFPILINKAKIILANFKAFL